MSQSQLDDLWPEAIEALRRAHEALYFGRDDKEKVAESLRNVLISYQWITQASPAAKAALEAVMRMDPPAHMTDPELVEVIWGEGRA